MTPSPQAPEPTKPNAWAYQAAEKHPELDPKHLIESRDRLRAILAEPWDKAGTLEWITVQHERVVAERNRVRTQIDGLRKTLNGCAESVDPDDENAAYCGQRLGISVALCASCVDDTETAVYRLTSHPTAP